MELLQNLKQYLPVIIIALIMGYFLGLMISTTVDYRLKDAVINLPKPKNNITISLDKQVLKNLTGNGSITETFEGSKKVNKQSNPKTDKSKKTAKTIQESKNTNKNSKSKKNTSKETVNKKTNEKFTDLADVSKVAPKGYIENKSEYDDIIEDPNINVYSQAYTLSKKMIEDTQKLSPYKAYNSEETDQIYSSLDNIANYKPLVKLQTSEEDKKKVLRPASSPESLSTYNQLTDNYVEYDALPPREFRKPDYKAQRPWVNSTNKVLKMN